MSERLDAQRLDTLLKTCKVTDLKDDDEIAELPNEEVVLYRDGTHRYFLVDEDKIPKPGLKALTSVTGILGIIGSRQKTDGLIRWAVKEVQEGRDPFATRDNAATRGRSIHLAMERLARDGEIPSLHDFPEDDRPYVTGLANFWLKHRIKAEHTELIVADTGEGYAGRLDLLAEIDGKRMVLDLKTGKGRVYDEALVQVAAYRKALVASGYGPTDGAAVLGLAGDGSYTYVESLVHPGQFLEVVAVHQLLKDVRKLRPDPEVFPVAA